MIKNLLNADEDPPPGTKVMIEDPVVEQTPETVSREPAVETPVTISETPTAFEIPEDTKFFNPAPAEAVKDSDRYGEFAELVGENDFAEPANVEPVAAEPVNIEPAELEPAENLEAQVPKSAGPEIPTAFEPVEETPPIDLPTGTLFQSETKESSTAETFRQTGLAWSAGVVFFGSVIFMMIFGWFADLLLGSTPWGLVGGIILGGIIGFIQFFRITSQIFRK